MYRSPNHHEWLPLTEVISMQNGNVKSWWSRSYWSKKCPNLCISGPWLQFEFTYGYEMMHKAWSCISEMPYCILRSSVNCQCHTRQKNDPNWPLFRVLNPVRIHGWFEITYKVGSGTAEVPYRIAKSYIQFQDHTWQKSPIFNPIHWNLTYDLDNQQGPSSVLLQAFGIISKTPANYECRNLQSGNADDFAPIWAFQFGDSNSNSRMTTR